MSDDNSWVFDSLVCFLHGPVWNAPLQTFIEEKCFIFDPDMKQEDSNSEYLKIHQEYKNLVDFMLGSFMEEMQINPEQFEIACLEGRNQQQPNNPFSFQQGLFQQIWAANDINIFARMMTQRNLEIQLQALDLIERNQILQTNENCDDTTDEKKISLAGCIDVPIDDTQAAVFKEIEKVVENELADSSNNTSTDTGNEKNSNKIERLNLFFENREIPDEDIQIRQQYLREQRDKIVEIKKNVRAKHLNESIAKRNDRPSSAHIAQNILNGKNEEKIPDSNDQSVSFQLRKTLAKRLRSEVVEKNDF